MRIELEDIRLMVKTHDQQTLYQFENLLKRILGPENVEVEEIRENSRPGFGRFFAYFHIHNPEGGSGL